MSTAGVALAEWTDQQDEFIEAECDSEESDAPFAKSHPDLEMLIGSEIDAEATRAAAALKVQDDPEMDEIAYSEETLGRAIQMLKSHVNSLWRTCGLRAPIPTIGIGPERSVDLYWKRARWTLLVNIPAAPNERATFYGDNYGLEKTKGSFEIDKTSNGILAWLMS